MTATARFALLCVALARAGAQPLAADNSSHSTDVIYELTDEEYYAMPRLFELDEYAACLAQRGVYCVGSFELSAPPGHQLFQRMVGWSNNWVDNFNHTRLHRGLCVTQRCGGARGPDGHPDSWFESCVNASTSAAYNMSARLYRLQYCRRGAGEPPALTANQRAFAAAVAILLALAVISTGLDLMLSDQAKKELGWALSWSARRSWRALTAPAPRPAAPRPAAPRPAAPRPAAPHPAAPLPAAAARPDLRALDGLRVFCMMSVILEHVCWLATLSYIADTRNMERIRRQPDVVLMTNSTLVVQIFFLMSSFLLAHKLLQQKNPAPVCRTFFDTMLNRIVRISPSYFLVVWFASSWWERLGDGPLWAPLVGGEAAVCRRKWWTHLLYLNNLVYPDDKCLIPTWYLAADMQLYAAALLLTLLLRGSRAAVPVLAALYVVVTGLNFTLAYLWHLVPNFVLHRPESVRAAYGGEASFNVLYQSPLGNAPATLGGLLLAHLYARPSVPARVVENKALRWLSVCGAPGAAWWAALSPRLAGAGAPGRLRAAALAALERPVFVALVLAALLGAISGVKSPWRTWLSRAGGAAPRLAFGALLLHLPLNQALLASRAAPAQLDRPHAIYQWFGVGVISFAAAVPLALLVELPAQALYRELRRPPGPARRPAGPAPDPTQEKLDKSAHT